MKNYLSMYDLCEGLRDYETKTEAQMQDVNPFDSSRQNTGSGLATEEEVQELFDNTAETLQTAQSSLTKIVSFYGTNHPKIKELQEMLTKLLKIKSDFDKIAKEIDQDTSTTKVGKY